MNKKEANKHFPLWRVDFEEYVYGKDSGNPWDDPENDIRKKGKIKYYKKENVNSDWKLEYDELFGDFDWAMHKAPLTLHKLREIIPPKDTTVMFEWQDRMFTFKYWFDDQKCVFGESIDDYVDEYEDESSVKADILNSYVHFYDKDCLVIKGGNLYLNGAMVMTRKYLKDVFGIDKHEVEMMYPISVQSKIKQLFPQAKTYNSWCAGGVL
jgi:hypothetical protein